MLTKMMQRFVIALLLIAALSIVFVGLAIASGDALDLLSEQQAAAEEEKTPEDLAWEEVNCLDLPALEAFLQAFPDGEHAEDAQLAKTLQETMAAIRADQLEPKYVVPFAALGDYWQYWKSQAQAEGFTAGILGYFAQPTEIDGQPAISSGISFLFSIATPYSGSGPGAILFDAYGNAMCPTNDGSIVAFTTNGLDFGFLGEVVFKTSGDEPIFFGVIDEIGLVHLLGEGEVTFPDAPPVEVASGASAEAEPPPALDEPLPVTADSASREVEAIQPEPLTYTHYVATGHGFTLDLPTAGEIFSPSSPDWVGDEEEAFEWSAQTKGPMFMITGRRDRLGNIVDSAMFADFCEGLLSNWPEQSADYEVVTANERIEFSARRWNLIEITDYSAAADGAAIYYSILSTYAGDSFYTLTFYYLEPVDAEIREVIDAVLSSFSLIADPASASE